MWISSIFLQLQHRCTVLFFSLLNSNPLRCLLFRILKQKTRHSKQQRKEKISLGGLNDVDCQLKVFASIFTHLSNAFRCNNQHIFNIPCDQFHYVSLNSIAKRAQMSGVFALFWIRLLNWMHESTKCSIHIGRRLTGKHTDDYAAYKWKKNSTIATRCKVKLSWRRFSASKSFNLKNQ